MSGSWSPPTSIEEARERARERFRSKLAAGEDVGSCGCGDDDPVSGLADGSPVECVVGVRFRDSGRVYYFRSANTGRSVGDWVVVPTSRGEEAGQVVIAEHQVKRALLQGELSTVVRRLDTRDIELMDTRKRAGSEAVRQFGDMARARHLGIKAISAAYAFDGTTINVHYSIPDRERAPDSTVLRELAGQLASVLGCRVELRQVGPRDEARLLGGLGRCGRTLCCSSWLPVFPEISMSMAKNQDLPLNPSKVSGVCGRLLCCLSYENEQYRQMKAIMPKLGQAIETPGGQGMVVSMHLLKELVTVRLGDDNSEVTFRCDELGLGAARSNPIPAPVPQEESRSPRPDDEEADRTEQAAAEGNESSPGKRRRRRRGRRGGSAS